MLECILELIIDAIAWLLVGLLLNWAEPYSRGWNIYRGDAAEISAEYK